MRESVSESKVLILLSDGDNTAGNIDPLTASEIAKAYGIKFIVLQLVKTEKSLLEKIILEDLDTLKIL